MGPKGCRKTDAASHGEQASSRRGPPPSAFLTEILRTADAVRGMGPKAPPQGEPGTSEPAVMCCLRAHVI